MATQVKIRSGKDRLRYSLSFEMTLMLMLVPAGAFFFDKHVAEIGMLGLILSGKAMLVNLGYNWAFDTIDSRAGRVSSDRSTLGRLLHATGFEMSLLVTSLPIYVWWFDLTLLQAILMDLAVTSLVVMYTYLFTLGYDRLFPVLQDHRLQAA